MNVQNEKLYCSITQSISKSFFIVFPQICCLPIPQIGMEEYKKIHLQQFFYTLKKEIVAPETSCSHAFPPAAAHGLRLQQRVAGACRPWPVSEEQSSVAYACSREQQAALGQRPHDTAGDAAYSRQRAATAVPRPTSWQATRQQPIAAGAYRPRSRQKKKSAERRKCRRKIGRNEPDRESRDGAHIYA